MASSSAPLLLSALLEPSLLVAVAALLLLAVLLVLAVLPDFWLPALEPTPAAGRFWLRSCSSSWRMSLISSSFWVNIRFKRLTSS
jgi:hypothetical protein